MVIKGTLARTTSDRPRWGSAPSTTGANVSSIHLLDQQQGVQWSRFDRDRVVNITSFIRSKVTKGGTYRPQLTTAGASGATRIISRKFTAIISNISSKVNHTSILIRDVTTYFMNYSTSTSPTQPTGRCVCVSAATVSKATRPPEGYHNQRLQGEPAVTTRLPTGNRSTPISSSPARCRSSWGTLRGDQVGQQVAHLTSLQLTTTYLLEDRVQDPPSSPPPLPPQLPLATTHSARATTIMTIKTNHMNKESSVTNKRIDMNITTSPNISEITASTRKDVTNAGWNVVSHGRTAGSARIPSSFNGAAKVFRKRAPQLSSDVQVPMRRAHLSGQAIARQGRNSDRK
ncbi:hypothetical protein BDK51DRAFT_52545 [Blyttiomyces helicus]|uniref:Uncharacterized protein n=1 Tax=Blyttiomyces helicus TaxID=388810 RepID=A0A4P9WPB5_9FUNG|nr:hypothetical protein BDK51DRAFT_52545 [Blyttiomyces helicus]|eukprot:RKO94342.1 hypothetical protein BDK51DRAFT_52545 [Blyttiomyces helicus]